MKKIHFFIVLFLSSLFINAQTNIVKPKVVSGSDQYNLLKSQGLLGNYEVIYTKQSTNNSKVSSSPLSVQSASDCASAQAFCADNTTGTTFPASTTTTAQPGPNYGCLSSRPNPAWYFFQVSQSGSINIGISGTGGGDVDFVCWGPFTQAVVCNSLTSNCFSPNCPSNTTNPNFYPSGNMTDCSYSGNATETCHIPSAITGQYYMLLITNFSGMAQNINFNQTGGTGATNCNFFAAVTSATICSGTTTTITSNTSLQSPTYLWSPGGQTTSSISVSPTVTTIYTLTTNGLNSGGTPTVSVNTGTVTVVDTPSLTLPSTLTTCGNASISITSTISPSSNYSYQWTNGATTSTTSANTSTVISLTATSIVGGCVSNVATTTIIANPNPTITIDPFINLCITNTSVATPSVTGGLAPYSFTWTPLSAGNTPTATVSSAGTNTIIVADQNSCTSSVSFTVTVNNPTVTIIPNPVTMCGPGTTTLNTTVTGATSYSWSNGSSSPTTIVSSPGSYTVSVLTNGCNAINSITLTPLIIPTVALSPNASMCQGSLTTIFSNSIVPLGAYTYTWSDGSHLATLAVNTATIVTLQVTNTLTGCISDVSNTCSVVPVSNPTVSLSNNPVVFCNGGTAILTSTITGGTPTYTYSWNPASLGTAATATTGTVGTYTLLVSDQNLCKGSSTVSVIKSVPSVTLASPDLTLCPGDCTILNASAATPYTPVTYVWSSSSSTSQSLTVCSIGTTTVTITDSKGCTATTTISTTQDVIPVANFAITPSYTVSPGDVITLNNTSTISSGTISSNTWAFGDGGGAIVSTPTYSYSGVGSFMVTLIVTGSNGCKDTISEICVVDAFLTIPNVITPNGDGINDYLKFKNLEVFSSNTLSIYNRWGKKIFEQENYKNDWNGGGHLDGTYFLVLSVPDAKPQVYQGYFQLFK
jgi:gliding motility-associated-like protein